MQDIIDRIQSLNVGAYYKGKTIRQENLRTIRESIVDLALSSGGAPILDSWIRVYANSPRTTETHDGPAPYGIVEAAILLPSGATVTIPLVADVTFERTELAIARIIQCFSGCTMSYADCNELRSMLSEATGVPGHAIDVIAHRTEGRLEAIVTRGGESWSASIAAVGIVHRKA
jgi:hypothetical protein